MDTSGGKLDELQKRVLGSLAAVRPPFILGGGGALAGVPIAYRETRDIDLFWREVRLAEDGLNMSRLQRSPLFAQLRVADVSSVVVVEPSVLLLPPKC